ncbi:MAG: ferrous iron transport protein B [Myxococcales bacterium FL481]|nr:MAG: ferrous iron transport protein B [Myxococcales bacterium FL481]
MRTAKVALVGNPNVGKTSLFNALTGSRHAVGNYSGITVDVREGAVRAGLVDRPVVLLDLPGIYSTTAVSDDERLAFEQLSADRPPEAVIIVADATNLARNLYLVLQVFELGLPSVLALNMSDVARKQGRAVDVERLAAALGVPVVATVGRTGEGGRELLRAVAEVSNRPARPRLLQPLPEHRALRAALEVLEAVCSPARARGLMSAELGGGKLSAVSSEERAALGRIEPDLAQTAVAQLVALRYREVDRLLEQTGVIVDDGGGAGVGMQRSVAIDRVLTHPVAGLLAFGLAMTLLFQGLFSWSDPLISVIETMFGALADVVGVTLGPGLFTDLLTQGVIAGAGNVLVFVPQIALLFVVLGLLEDSGYLARAAFLIDRLMTALGLSGKAFVPLLSGYACAIPAILGTRTIAGFRQRLAVIFMIPYVSCSARLPVYALVIGALFDADRSIFGPFSLGGLLLSGMYLLSTVSALVVGGVFHRFMPAPRPPLVLELPPYRRPRLRNVLGRAYDRTMDFVRDAGTVILAATIVLWAALSFPRVEPDPSDPHATAIEHSVGGRLGKAMEPALAPIGQDWRIGVGLVGSFAAREVLVSTLGLVYGIEAGEEDDRPLRERLRSATDPRTGKPRYTPLRGLALMVFFVYACQCMSTLAVVKRETRSWRWPLLMLGTMTSVAYLMAWLVYQGGRLLGFE